MPHLAELHESDTLSLDAAQVAREREELKAGVDGEFTLRDEAAGIVQHVLKATHMVGQNSAMAHADPIGAMMGGNDQDLEQINQRLTAAGSSEAGSLQELTPWTLAFLIVDIVTLVFAELTDELPTL